MEQASTDSGDAEEIGATALSLRATEVGICWHSCWATAVELASTDSGDAEEARRSCEIEATSPCPTGEGGGAIADCCEVRISISEKSGASSDEDGADKRQGVSFMVNRYLEKGLQSIKIQVHPAAILGLAIRRPKIDQLTFGGIRKALREGVHICHAHW